MVREEDGTYGLTICEGSVPILLRHKIGFQEAMDLINEYMDGGEA